MGNVNHYINMKQNSIVSAGAGSDLDDIYRSAPAVYRRASQGEADRYRSASTMSLDEALAVLEELA